MSKRGKKFEQTVEATKNLVETVSQSLPPLPKHFETVTVLVLSVALGIYIRTLHPTVAGGDSGELMCVAHELGVPHPPGYPTFAMYTKLGEVVLRTIVPSMDVGYAQNAASAFLSALAVMFLYVAGVYITNTHEGGFLAAFLFGFSTNVWTYAVSTEVFPMNNFFISLLLAMGGIYYRAYVEKKPRHLILYTSAFVCGIALTNQHTSVLFVVPIVVWVLYLDRHTIFLQRKTFLIVTIMFLLGISPYLYLPISARSVISSNSWGDCGSWDGFMVHFFRKEYGTFSLASKEATYRVNNFARAWRYFFADMCEQTIYVFWCFAAFAGIGCYVWWGPKFRQQPVSYERLLFFVWVLYNNFFNYLSNLPIDQPLFLGVQQRFWIQPLTILTIFIGVGFVKLFSKVPSSVRIAIAIAICAAQVGWNFNARDESTNYSVRDFGRGIIMKLPNRSIFLTKGDIVINSARFVQVTENVRRDIRITDQELMTYEWYNNVVKKAYPDVIYPGRFYFPTKPNCYTIRKFIEANRENGTRRIFIGHGFKDGDDSWQGHFVLRPYGFITEVIPKAKERLKGKEILQYMQEIRNVLPLPENFALPPPGKYPATSWEAVIEGDYWTSWHTYGYYLLEWAQNQETAVKKSSVKTQLKVLYEAKEVFEVVTKNWAATPSYIFRNLGVTFQTLIRLDPQPEYIEGAVDAFTKYHDIAKNDGRTKKEELANVMKAVEYYKQYRLQAEP